MAYLARVQGISVECDNPDGAVSLAKAVAREAAQLPEASFAGLPPVESAPRFPFLRTYKPMLKRARGTTSYRDVRVLLKLWMHCIRVTKLLEHQNKLLYLAARERDALRATRQ